MTTDEIILNERLFVPGGADAAASPGRVVHRYGDRVLVVESTEAMSEARERQAIDEMVARVQPASLARTEAFGLAAFQLRNSPSFREAKRNRPRQGEAWDFTGGGCVDFPPTGGAGAAAAPSSAAAPPTSAFLEGSVAVGIIMVSGPTVATTLSQAEQTKIIAEVQAGLSYFAATNPSAGLSFAYDIHVVTLDVEPDPAAADLEAHFRDPALASLGFSGSWAGVGQYVESIRQSLGTRWTFCALFTKYPVGHFAYANLGGPRMVMHYDNDGWGPDNIDRVFAHETGHIFGAPDEYANSGCNCGGQWGRYRKPNTNCANCAPGGGISCIMKANDWSMCPVTPAHIGWTSARLFSKKSRLAMDVHSASDANGAPIIQWPYHGGENQLFRPDPVGGGWFRLVGQRDGKVLDIEGASVAGGARAIQWDWHGGDNQLFRIERLGDGCVRLVAKHSGKVLDVTGGSDQAAAQIIQWDWHGGDNQRWLLTAPIVALHSGKALDVEGASNANVAPIIQWAVHGGGNQIFQAEVVAGEWFRIVAQHSGKVLDIEGASGANGARAIQYDWHGGDNQLFRFDALGDGHSRIVAKHSGKVLDVFQASQQDGAQIIQWDWHGGPNQRWLVPFFSTQS